MEIRAVKKGDLTRLQNVICNVWGFESYCSKGVAQRLSKWYLYNALAFSDFALCLSVRNAVCGVIMGDCLKARNTQDSKKDSKLDSKLDSIKIIKQKYAKLANSALKNLQKTISGNEVANLFLHIESIYENLHKMALKKRKNIEYDGVLNLFVIDKKFQGKGFGLKLYNEFLNFCNANKIKNFYLFTDTESNFRFYKKQGLNLKATHKQTFRLYGETFTTTFFLYDCEI